MPGPERIVVAGRESLTVAGIDGLVHRVKPSVHVGRIREEHDFHGVGPAGFRHRPIRFFSAHSAREDAPSNLLAHSFVCAFFHGLAGVVGCDLLFPIDLHIVFGTVRNLFLIRLKQEELFERHLHYLSCRDLDDERDQFVLKDCSSSSPKYQSLFFFF